jgi:hypothetical protein
VSRFAALCCVLLLGGCVASPPPPMARALPAAVRDRPERFLVVTVRNPVAPPTPSAASTPRGYGGSRYAVGGAARAASRGLARDYALEEVSGWPIALLGVHCLVYAIPAGADPAQLVESLGRDRRVESVQPLLAFAGQSGDYNDPYAELQRNLVQLAVPQAQALTRGAGVRVAVIDTGVDVGHPDLRPHGATARNFVDADAGQFRADAHGTAVAGIIAAVPNNGLGIVGVAPDVELLALKACWQTGRPGTPAVCNSFTLAQALAAAIDAHADVINLSLAGPSDPLLTRLVRRALAGGAIVVGAVPRDGAHDRFPVDVEGVIAVDTLDAATPAAGTVRAPGRDVLSLAPVGHYDFFSGSSLATAQVTGLVALLRAESPHLTGVQAARLLIDSGAGGAPNACAALAGLLHRDACGRPGEARLSATTTRGRVP